VHTVNLSISAYQWTGAAPVTTPAAPVAPSDTSTDGTDTTSDASSN
jgi:hypothetical protein